MIPRVRVWDWFGRGARVALASEPIQPGDVAVAGSLVLQVAPSCAVDCRFQPLTHFGVRFQSDSGDDAWLELPGPRETMRRYAVENDLGACLTPILTTCERRKATSPAVLMTAQAPPDAAPWLSVSWASWCSRNADTSSGFARKGIHAGFSPSACRGLCWSCFACSEEPSDESRWATKLAAPAAQHSELAAVGAAQVVVGRLAAAMGVALASRPCLDGVDLMKADVWKMRRM